MMAEVVGLVASIIGITGAAAQLSLGLYQIARSLKNAGQEVRAIADDTSHMSRVLDELRRHLSEQAPASMGARAIVEDVINTCGKIQEDGEYLLELLKPLVEMSKVQYRRVFLSIRWLFEKSKFAYHRDLLQSLKTTLQLILSVIALQTAPDKMMFDRLLFEVASLRETVDSGIRNMERRLDSPQTTHIFTITQQTRHSITGAGQPQRPAQISSPDLEVVEIDEDSDATQNLALDLSLQQSRNRSNDPQPSDFDDEEGIETDESSSATLVGPMALVPYFRAYFVQEKVSQFAGHVLESAESERNDGNTSETPDAERITINQSMLNSVGSRSNQNLNPSAQSSTADVQTAGSSVYGARKSSEVQSHDDIPRSSSPLRSENTEQSNVGRIFNMQPPQDSSRPRSTTPSNVMGRNSGTDRSVFSDLPETAQSATSWSERTRPSVSEAGTEATKSSSLLGSDSGFVAPDKAKDPDVIRFLDHQGEFVTIPFRECRVYDDHLPTKTRRKRLQKNPPILLHGIEHINHLALARASQQK